MMFGAMSGSPEPEGFVHTFDTDDRFEDGWENLSGSGWTGYGSWAATNNSIGKRFASPLKAGTKIRVNTSVVPSPYGCNQGAGLSPSGSEGNNSTSIFAQVGGAWLWGDGYHFEVYQGGTQLFRQGVSADSSYWIELEMTSSTSCEIRLFEADGVTIKYSNIMASVPVDISAMFATISSYNQTPSVYEIAWTESV